MDRLEHAPFRIRELWYHSVGKSSATEPKRLGTGSAIVAGYKPKTKKRPRKEKSTYARADDKKVWRIRRTNPASIVDQQLDEVDEITQGLAEKFTAKSILYNTIPQHIFLDVSTPQTPWSSRGFSQETVVVTSVTDLESRRTNRSTQTCS
eukprot:scaffold3939_cov166-Amphora_coffeaeformis.AAC.8